MACHSCIDQPFVDHKALVTSESREYSSCSRCRKKAFTRTMRKMHFDRPPKLELRASSCCFLAPEIRRALF